MQARPRRAEAAGARRQHEAPHRGEQRAPDRRRQEARLAVDPSVDAGHEQHGRVAHVVGEVLSRAHHPLLHGSARRVVLEEVPRRERHVLVDGERPGIDRSEGRPLGRVGDDDEVPALLVRPRRGLQCDLDALAHHVEGDRPGEVEPPAHRPGGAQQLVGREVEKGRHGRRS